METKSKMESVSDIERLSRAAAEKIERVSGIAAFRTKGATVEDVIAATAQIIHSTFTGVDLYRAGYEQCREDAEEAIHRKGHQMNDIPKDNQLKAEETRRTAELAAREIGDVYSKVIRGTYSFDREKAIAIILKHQQDWCDHCSADLNGVSHILCEKDYRLFAGPHIDEEGFNPNGSSITNSDLYRMGVEDAAKRAELLGCVPNGCGRLIAKDVRALLPNHKEGENE